MSDHICPGCGLRFDIMIEPCTEDTKFKLVPVEEQPARPVGPSRAAWESGQGYCDPNRTDQGFASRAAWERAGVGFARTDGRPVTDADIESVTLPRSTYREFWTCYAGSRQPDDPSPKPRDEEWAVR